MIHKIDAPVSVIAKYDHTKRRYQPAKIKWEGREYKVIQIGYHHTFRNGRDLIHVFSVDCRQLSFELHHDSVNLTWKVKRISDDLPD